MSTIESNSQSLPQGTQLEEFVIEKVLGAGGFGITYLAHDSRLGRKVVIKENLPAQFCYRDTRALTVAARNTHAEDVDNFEWSLQNFAREASMLASLDHPGIVRVLRSFEAYGTAYFVMPFVDGVSLSELAESRAAKNRPFAEEELSGLLERTLNALGYLHDRGIYHRDIKPANILITNEGIPVLIDFGSARQKLSERSMTVVESAGYTPFEQLQSHGNIGPWSDIYALGGTMAKVITGTTPPKAADRILDDPWTPLLHREELADYSEQLLEGIERAFMVDPKSRWQSAGDWLGHARQQQSQPMPAAPMDANYSPPPPPPVPPQGQAVPVHAPQAANDVDASSQLNPYQAPAHLSGNALQAPVVASGNQVRPWIRLWARTVDMMLVGMGVGFAMGIVFPALLEMPEIMLGFVVTAIYVFVEPVWFAIMGSTPGKLLFKIDVRNQNQERLDYSQALKRTIKVWIYGLGLGIPFVSLVTYLVAYSKLTKNHVTTWDAEEKCSVYHQTLSGGRIVAIILVLLVLFYIAGVGSMDANY